MMASFSSHVPRTLGVRVTPAGYGRLRQPIEQPSNGGDRIDATSREKSAQLVRSRQLHPIGTIRKVGNDEHQNEPDMTEHVPCLDRKKPVRHL
jgi:hypothetical protein